MSHNLSEKKVLNMDTVIGDEETRKFFKTLVTRHVARDRGPRLDFLACPIALERDGGLLAREMEILLDVWLRVSLRMCSRFGFHFYFPGNGSKTQI